MMLERAIPAESKSLSLTGVGCKANKIQMLKVFNFTKVSYNCYRFDIYFKILALDRKYSSG